jgi:hypothetical protein
MYTNIGLVEHAKKALKERWGYVYGTFGTVLTEQLLKDKLKQYPSNVVAYESFIRANWMGKMVTDCVGLIKSYLWWNGVKAVYSSLYDVSANGMYERAKEKGPINTIPEIPGLCVWRNGHIGVYIGNGEVIEARGTKYGVVKTKIKERTFTHWLKCPFIQYLEPVKKEEPKPIIEGPHWADDAFSYLKNCGVVLNEKRFEDAIKRGEYFAVAAQQQAQIMELREQIKSLKGGNVIC